MASSGDGPPGQGGSDRKRMPKDMQGLLRLCAEMSDPSNPNETTSFRDMTEERREFLEKALNEMTVNPVQQMKVCVDQLKMQDDGEDSVEGKMQALEELQEWCEQIDLAIDLHKISGFEIFQPVLGHDEAEVRWQGCELIAILVQNNPYCQQAVLQENLLPALLQILDTDPDPTVKTKALFAISCFVRDFPPAQQVFLEKDGFSVIMRAMQTDVEKIKIKAAFMLSSMCTDQPQHKDILCDIGMIDQLVGHIGEEHAPYHEHIMSALLTVVRDHPRSRKECCRPELNLFNLLKKRKQEIAGQEEFQEELEYTEELLAILTKNNSAEEADR